MWSFRSSMGQSANKFGKIDEAVQNLGLLQKSGKQYANEIIEVFRQMNSNILTLKTEKEFLVREIQRTEKRTSGYSFKDKKIHLNEESTQTETDNEVSLSVINESLSCRNRELEQKVHTLEEQVKQDGASKGNILTAVACNVLLPLSGDDKYIPTGTEQEKELNTLQYEYEHVLEDKDCLNAEIRRLGEDLMTCRSHNEQAENKIKVFEQQILVLNQKLAQSIDKISSVRDGEYKVKTENKILQKTNSELEQANRDIRREIGEKINKIEKLQNQVTELQQQIDQYSIKFENQNTDFVQLQGRFQSKEREIQEQVRRVQILEQRKCDLENRIREYESNSFVHKQDMQRKDNKVKELENSVLQLENEYRTRENFIVERKREIEKLKSEVNKKESELSQLKSETEERVKKLKNELSLEAVKVRNEKTANDELCRKVSRLEEEISDFKLNYNQLETDFEIKEANNTQERNKLRNEIAELQNKEITITKENATLVQKCQSLEKEIEKLTPKERNKKYVSFHCVLKQPQSDQAISGIVSLLQQRFEDADIEIVPESKRDKNVPLIVVLYNLSRLTDDAKGALIGIEANADVALVVLHSKDIMRASDQVLTLPEFKKLGIIVDMSFISAKGLIHNELTTNAVNQLATYLNNH